MGNWVPYIALHNQEPSHSRGLSDCPIHEAERQRTIKSTVKLASQYILYAVCFAYMNHTEKINLILSQRDSYMRKVPQNNLPISHYSFILHKDGWESVLSIALKSNHFTCFSSIYNIRHHSCTINTWFLKNFVFNSIHQNLSVLKKYPHTWPITPKLPLLEPALAV